jgi:hypothetical protein
MSLYFRGLGGERPFPLDRTNPYLSERLLAASRSARRSARHPRIMFEIVPTKLTKLTMNPPISRYVSSMGYLAMGPDGVTSST